MTKTSQRLTTECAANVYLSLIYSIEMAMSGIDIEVISYRNTLRCSPKWKQTGKKQENWGPGKVQDEDERRKNR